MGVRRRRASRAALGVGTLALKAPSEPTSPLLVAMVGLPARGKTFVTTKLTRYLSWLGIRTRAFNVGDYRRARGLAGAPAAFFDPSNAEGQRARTAFADAALDDLLAWIRDGGEVGLYDATNVERSRRQHVLERATAAGVQTLFVEAVCADDAAVEANVRENKARSPDYLGVAPDAAFADFRARIEHYSRIYEPLGEADDALSYVKLVDLGRQVVVNRVQGWLGARIVFFLMNLRHARRRLFLTRHGESTYNLSGRIGGDPPLTERGARYAELLHREVTGRLGPGERLTVWTSTLRRTLETARCFRQARAWRALDEIDAGTCEELTYAELAARHPGEFLARAEDKLCYRYPRGESYLDVVQRLEPVIVDLEQEPDPLLVVGHQGVLRVLYGYLMGRALEDVPYLELPLHALCELTPTAYGYEERWTALHP